MNERRRLTYSFVPASNLVLAILLIVATISPPAKALDNFYTLYIGIILSWFLSAVINKPSFFIYPSRILFAIYIFFLYLLTILTCTDNLVLLKRHFALFAIFVLYTIFSYYRKYYPQYLKVIFVIIVLIWPIWAFLTAKEIMIRPHVAAIADKPFLESTYYYYTSKGVGGYGLVYSTVLLALILLSLLRVRVLDNKKYLYILGLTVLCYFLVIMSGFFIGLIALFLGTTIVLFPKRFNITNVNFYLFVFITIIGLILICNLLPSAAENVFVLYEQKLLDTQILLQEGDIYGSVEGRMDVYLISIETFLRNPLFGSVFSDKALFGNHSLIFDIFSLYGIGIGILLIYILFSFPIKLTKNAYYGYSRAAIATLFSLLIILLLNNDIPEIGVILYFVLPVVVKLEYKKMSRLHLKT